MEEFTFVLCLLLVDRVESARLELAVDERASEARTVPFSINCSFSRTERRILQELLRLAVASRLAVLRDVIFIRFDGLGRMSPIITCRRSTKKDLLPRTTQRQQ